MTPIRATDCGRCSLTPTATRSIVPHVFVLMIPALPRSTLFPYTTLFRSQVVIPMASGELLTKIDKAFTELVEIGLAEAPADGWRVFGAQSAGCNPIAVALHGGTDVITPVRPTGIAKSLNIGDPAAGVYALEAVQRTGGWMAYADDDEIRDAIRLLARTTGIFAETAGGVTVAVLRKLV